MFLSMLLNYILELNYFEVEHIQYRGIPVWLRYYAIRRRRYIGYITRRGYVCAGGGVIQFTIRALLTSVEFGHRYVKFNH